MWVRTGISAAFCTGSTTSCVRGSRGGTCSAASDTDTGLFRRDRRWCQAGVWEWLVAACAAERGQPCRVHLATTHVHAHPVSAGARRDQGGQDAQAQGRSRGGFGTKLHVLVDAQGGLLACCPDYVLADGATTVHRGAGGQTGDFRAAPSHGTD